MASYDYISGNAVNVTFFKDRAVEIDHVWVEHTAVPETVAFLTESGFGTETVDAPKASGHTAESAKRYLAKRIATDWKEAH